MFLHLQKSRETFASQHRRLPPRLQRGSGRHCRCFARWEEPRDEVQRPRLCSSRSSQTTLIIFLCRPKKVLLKPPLGRDSCPPMACLLKQPYCPPSGKPPFYISWVLQGGLCSSLLSSMVNSRQILKSESRLQSCIGTPRPQWGIIHSLLYG